MYMRMLVLLDGSELAEVVFKYARELSGRLHVDLDLLHVCSQQEAEQLPMRRAYIEQKAEALRAEVGDFCATLGDSAMGQNIKARGSVVVGYHAEEILKYIDENDIDLVMMSTHGSSGIKVWDLGSVASKVIHASKVPVWLVPSEMNEDVIRDTMPTRILVIPLSGSKQAEAVIPHAMNIAQRRGAESDLVLLHVLEPADPNAPPAAPGAAEKQRAKMKDYLEGVAKRIRESGLKARTEVLSGDPAATILQFITDNPPQLLAITTGGQTGVTSFAFGIVAEGLVHAVKKTPLLLVRANSK